MLVIVRLLLWHVKLLKGREEYLVVLLDTNTTSLFSGLGEGNETDFREHV
jgi:hypothetical protein